MRLVQIALDVSPDSVSYLDTQAWILYRQGRFEEAHRILDPIVQHHSNNSELLFHLACIKHRMSQDGREYFRRALNLEQNPVQRGRYEREWKSLIED